MQPLLSENKKVDVVIRTFNSAHTLERCIRSVKDHIPYEKIIVVDHCSTDSTREIALSHNVDYYGEEVGLGFATKLGISKSSTEFMLFVDSDVEIVSGTFFQEAMKYFVSKRVGAVVGCSVGYIFAYGLPLGLTIFRREFASGVHMPDRIQGRETYYFQENLKKNSLKVRYVKDAMIHRSEYRKIPNWPEWQGAQIRFTPGNHYRQVIWALAITFMMHFNSRNLKNIAYSPIYYFKILVGFMNPERWGKIDRREVSLSGNPERGG